MIGSTRIREGDWIALDGSSGDVSVGRREVVFADAPEAAVISQWREGEAQHNHLKRGVVRVFRSVKHGRLCWTISKTL